MNDIVNRQDNTSVMEVPSFKHCKELRLATTDWDLAMGRFHEAKNLVPGNYSSLEFAFQSAWRESRKNAIDVGEAICKAKQNVEEAKADIILDTIPKMLEERKLSKTANNADFRKAVMARDENYQKSLEHLDKLEALLAHFESHMKTMENTSRYLKKQMDYFIRSGVVG
tara:strand:+ start:9527 stop:10033 length:507 start_codon:yes stop_codon:yes gene_type:complete